MRARLSPAPAQSDHKSESVDDIIARHAQEYNQGNTSIGDGGSDRGAEELDEEDDEEDSEEDGSEVEADEDDEDDDEEEGDDGSS